MESLKGSNVENRTSKVASAAMAALALTVTSCRSQVQSTLDHPSGSSKVEQPACYYQDKSKQMIPGYWYLCAVQPGEKDHYLEDRSGLTEMVLNDDFTTTQCGKLSSTHPLSYSFPDQKAPVVVKCLAEDPSTGKLEEGYGCNGKIEMKSPELFGEKFMYFPRFSRLVNGQPAVSAFKFSSKDGITPVGFRYISFPDDAAACSAYIVASDSLAVQVAQ